jgi:two-component system sensor histidine kinase HydH
MAVLFPIFAFTTYEGINRQKEHNERLLQEKGAALIRSFEAGTRTGVMGVHWDSFKLQQLLTETAQQPDIRYLMVTNMKGRIVVHSDPKQNGQFHNLEGLDLAAISRMDHTSVDDREVQNDSGQRVYEVISRFSPSAPSYEEKFQKVMEKFGISMADSLIIFVGLDMDSIESARRADMRHTIVMGAVLLLICFGGFVLLMLFQSNRATRLSLLRIKAFSDNLVENMPIGLVALDTDRTIATVNQVAASMLDLHVVDTLDKKASLVLPPEIYELLDRLNRVPEIIDCQIECKLANGRSLPVEATATVLKDETGQFFGYAFLLKDMSEVEALRKEVIRTQRLATVGRLAAGVAHEIRNPLSSIKGFATYFKERYPDVEEDQQIAGIMIQEVDKLNRVVGQLLEFARPVSIAKSWTPLAPVIDDSLKLVERQAQEKEITIEQEIFPSSLHGWFDPGRINQVLLNLYINAMDAMESGGVLKVSASLSTDSNAIVIQVSDTGSGLDPENMTHIFDPYFTTKPSGTGLGLAIVHNIIEAHHGHIIPKTRPGEGLCMNIVLPNPDANKEEEQE